MEELVDAVATKRYTKARVRRVLTYILVNAVETPLPEAVHVLGFFSSRPGLSQERQGEGGPGDADRQRALGQPDPAGGCGLSTGR